MIEHHHTLKHLIAVHVIKAFDKTIGVIGYDY